MKNILAGLKKMRKRNKMRNKAIKDIKMPNTNKENSNSNNNSLFNNLIRNKSDISKQKSFKFLSM